MPVINKNRIKDLPRITNQNDLLGKIIEVENITGTDQNYSVSVPTLIQTVNSNLGAPKKATRICVRTYDANDSNYNAGYPATLVSESTNKDLCLGTICRVELPAPKEYILQYDLAGQYQVFVDSTFAGNKISAKWVEVGSAADRSSNIPESSPFTPKYSANDVVKKQINGIYKIFTAKKDLVLVNFPDNQIPEPTGLAADMNWLELNSQPAPNFSQFGQIACRFYYNSEVDQYGGDTIEELIKRPGILYINRQATVELGANAGTYHVVYDGSTTPQFQAYVDGSLASGVVPAKFEKINYASTAVVDWSTGKQIGGTFVIYANKLYRVKNDLNNSQTAPDSNPANYQLLSFDDSNVVHKTGDEAIAGNKLFSGNVSTTAKFVGDGSQISNLNKADYDTYGVVKTGDAMIYIDSNGVLDVGVSGGLAKEYESNTIFVNTSDDINEVLNYKIPSLKFVRDYVAAHAGSAGSSTSTLLFPEFTCSAAGAQTINLPTGATNVVSVFVLESTGYVRAVYPANYSVNSSVLTITATANLKAGDKIAGYYSTASTNGSGTGSDSSSTSNINILEFAFNYGYADDFSTVITSRQAGTYTASTMSNVNAVVYKKNNSTVAMPITLVAGDTLSLTITRTDATKGAVITIQ